MTESSQSPPSTAAHQQRRLRPSRMQIAIALGVTAVVVIGTLGAVHLLAQQRSSRAASGESLALGECDAASLVPCNQQAALVTIPIADTGLSLTYSSQWAQGRTDRPDWNANSLGLGDFALDAVQRYDANNGVIIGGDGSWRLVSETPAGAGQRAVPSLDGSLAYVFDTAGRHVRTVDGHLGMTLLTITYDSAGRLARVDGTYKGAPAQLVVQRASDGAPHALVGIDGAVTQLDVDRSGRLTAVHEPQGVIQLAWSGSLITSETDAMGAMTHFAYDSRGRLTSETDPDGVVQRLQWVAVANGFEVRVSTARGRVSIYRSERAGNVIQRSYVAAGGATTIETVSSDGTRRLKMPDGTTRTVGAVGSSEWGAAAPLLTPDVTTWPGGVSSRTEITQNLREQGGSPYTLSGSVTITVNGRRWVQTFDPSARSVTLTDPVGRRSIDTYDDRGLLLSATAPQTAALTYAYDAHRRETSVSVGAGSSAQTTRYAYDASTGKITETLPDGRTTVTTVDPAGNPSTVTAPDGSTTVETFDAAGRLTQLQPPGGPGYTLGSSPGGRATAFLPPPVGSDTSMETYRYDSDGNLTAVSGPRTMNYTYDAAGRLVGVAFDQGTTTASYDSSTGLLAQTSDPGGVRTTYSYSGSLLDKLNWSGPLNGSVVVSLDANGRTIAEFVDGLSMSLTYDASGDVTGIGQLTLSRDQASGLVTASTLGSVQTAEQYDSNDQLIRETTTVSGKIVLDLRYARDAMGRITTQTQANPDGSTSTTVYLYDAAGRVTQIADNGSTIETDTYDAAGNRITVARPGGVTHATYDARDRVANWGATAYSWAPDGDLVAVRSGSGSQTFTFDDIGRLRKVVLANGHTVRYLIDADGRRIGREVDGKLVAGYLYDPTGNVVAETSADGMVTARYGYDDLGHLALIDRGGSTYRVVTNAVGSPLAVINATTGAIVDAVSYDAWGRIKDESAPGTIPFGFAGGLADPDTGFVHFGARDYDPQTGRWTAPDPLGFSGGDDNLYRYAAGDPVNNADPTGQFLAEHCYGSTCQSIPCDNCESLPPGSFVTHCYGPACTSIPCDNCSGHPPGSPPPSMQSPPQTQNTMPPRGTSWECSGDCTNQNGWYCSGECQGSPRGVVCHGYCSGPNGEFCENANCAFGNNGSLACDGGRCGNGSHTCASHCRFGYGDVHLITGGGTHVDFQAAGEFIALISPDGKLQIQTRQGPTTAGSVITFNVAVAASVDGDRVGVYAREPSFLVVNGTAVIASDVEETLPHGGNLVRHGGFVTLTWVDGSVLTITHVADTLDYSFRPTSGAGAALTGLLGDGDGKPGDLVGRDGTVLIPTDPAYHTKLYAQFGNSWRISQAESLFDYQPGERTATFTNLAIPYHLVDASTLPASTRASAERICRALGVISQPLLDDCILDVAETGNPLLATGESLIAAAGTPPGSEPPTTAQAGSLAFGQVVSGSITQPNSHASYTFTASANAIVYLKAGATCDNDLHWNLFRPDGSLQGYNLGCGDIGRSVLGTSGTWTVQVASNNGSVGPYSFTVLDVPQVVTTPISLGQRVNGAVTRVGAWYDYTFTATAGQVVFLKAQGTCVNWLQWRLFRPDRSQQSFNGSCGDMGRQVLGQSGTWTVEVYSDIIATGSFAFTVEASQ